MIPVIAIDKNVLFMQSEAPVNLRTSRWIIYGRDHWMLIGEGWWQLGVHAYAIPEIDHPVQTIHAPHFPTPALLQLSVPPDQWLDIKISHQVIQ
jgi:hypothetical protein